MRSRNSKVSRRIKARLLRAEGLEARTMMAGDVTVHVIDGNLVVEGDMEGNRIGIASGMSPGTYLVGGLPSADGDVTTVNGQTGRVPFSGVRGNIRVGLGAGDDVVNIPSLLAAGDVSIRSGEGHDRVHVGLPPVEGQDPHGPTVYIRGALEIGLGAGDDAAAIHGMTSRGLFVAGDGGNDRIGMGGVRVERAIMIGAGDGEDSVALRHVQGVALEVNAGNGNDQVRVVDAAFRNMAVRLGAGDDTLALGHTRAGTAFLDGNDGSDTLENLGGNRFRRLAVMNFEHRGGMDGIMIPSDGSDGLMHSDGL